MDPISIIVIIVVALLVLGLALWLLTKKRKERHTHEAHEHREVAREELSDVQQRKQAAAAAQARAEEARLEAERADQVARETHVDARDREASVEERIRTADKLDPDVDHKSDDYRPDPDRIEPRTGTYDTETRGTRETHEVVDHDRGSHSVGHDPHHTDHDHDGDRRL